LDNLTIQFEEMSENVSTLESHAQAVLDEWLIIEQDAKDAIKAILASLIDTNNTDYNAVKEDLENAQKEWENVYMQAQLLNIEIDINDAELSPGMSQAEVKSALEKGNTMSILEYYRRKRVG